MTTPEDTLIADIPGGRMASRPIHFIWMLDCSGSMSVNGKIAELNFAIREAIPEMRQAAEDNPSAELMVRCITFASGADWHLKEPTPVRDFTWQDVSTYGGTDMGKAFRLAAKALQTPPMPQRAMRPVLALVSDGVPTDDWRAGLRALDDTPWGTRAVRVAVAIGKDAEKSMLQEFLANPELQPLQAGNPRELVAAIRWASTAAIKETSRPTGDAAAPINLGPPPVDTTKRDSGSPDVW